MIGPDDDVPVPPGCERFDYELEVAAVIGNAGRDLDMAGARAAIFGYTLFNDWSARDIGRREIQGKLDTLSNRVVAGVAPTAVPAGRRRIGWRPLLTMPKPPAPPRDCAHRRLPLVQALSKSRP
ncbi:MAG: fumarylacetoacetate hydrolase family protein [Solirubrobacteraceae bacterium]